ncbi:hypothetical protein ACMD2_19306 [Ananas comosus]|uniref:Uncharacterized protein n=1 Tax=Ananas comosus TaxID=4615 RepID=A0A199W9J1_ANACO|nr:hypothetical protein ACMD2_19306 [Ananas comosus]
MSPGSRGGTSTLVVERLPRAPHALLPRAQRLKFSAVRGTRSRTAPSRSPAAPPDRHVEEHPRRRPRREKERRRGTRVRVRVFGVGCALWIESERRGGAGELYRDPGEGILVSEDRRLEKTRGVIEEGG